jgi:hypothetical protein
VSQESLTERDEDEAGHISAIVTPDTVVARAHIPSPTIVVSGGEAHSPARPLPTGRTFVELARTDPNVAEALRLTGTAKSLGWVELYKLYEIVVDDVDGGRQGIVVSGWTTSAKLDAFKASANRPDVSGIGARHARMKGAMPSRTIPLPEAEDLIRRLVRDWLPSLSS